MQMRARQRARLGTVVQSVPRAESATRGPQQCAHASRRSPAELSVVYSCIRASRLQYLPKMYCTSTVAIDSRVAGAAVTK